MLTSALNHSHSLQSQCAMRSPPVPRIPLAYTFHAQSGNAGLWIRSHHRMRMRNKRTSISIVCCRQSLQPYTTTASTLWVTSSFVYLARAPKAQWYFVCTRPWRKHKTGSAWAGISWWYHRVPVWDSLDPQCCLGEFSNSKTFWVRSHFRYKSMTLLGPLSQFSTTRFLTIFRPRVTILNIFMLILL